MKVIRFSEAESYEPEKDWKRVSLCSEEELSLEHFVKPAGHASPRHEHTNVQVLVVFKGKMTIETEKDGTQELSEGDAAYIPGGELHVVVNPLDEPSVGLDIFVPGRSFDFWLKRNRMQKEGAMNKKEAYIDKAKAKIQEWNAEIDRLEAKLKGVEADTRIKYDNQFRTLRQRRDELKEKVKALQGTSGDAWEEVKKGTEEALDRVKKAFDRIRSEIKELKPRNRE